MPIHLSQSLELSSFLKICLGDVVALFTYIAGLDQPLGFFLLISNYSLELKLYSQAKRQKNSNIYFIIASLEIMFASFIFNNF